MKRMVSLSLTLAMLAVTSPADAAKSCKNFVSTSADKWPTKQIALNTATTAWPARVTALHGPQYSNWSNASDKSSSCKLVTSGIGANLWACTVKAKPCILQ